MRGLLSKSLISCLLLTPVLCAPPPAARAVETETPLSIQTAAAEPEKAAAPVENAEEPPEEVGPTTFNGIEVPPLTDLSGETFETETKDGYWLVKHHSPWCHHCLAFAPIYQTLYEYYYTTTPVPQSSPAKDSQSFNSFTRYYNFHFGSLDCIAFGETCASHEVHSFPVILLFKDGKLVKKFLEEKDLEHLSLFIEEVLESARPGSRPKDGVKLPAVGATTWAPTAPTAKPLPPPSKVAKNKPAKAAVTPNLIGTSVPLSAESFQNLVTTTQDPWFIKFYAPWCHHCQNMAPNWAQLGRDMKERLNIGEVNCDTETRLCKDVRLHGYPTILFFQGGERIEYDGLRGFGDLVSFANKAIDISGGVQYVDIKSFEQMEKTEEVIFIYFFDHATTAEDFEALDRLTLSLIGHAKLVKTDDESLASRFKISTWPRLAVSRDKQPTYYTALAPKDMRDFRKVLEWMKSVWLPIVPELTASNSREIMDGRIVVLGVLTRDKEGEFVAGKQEIKNAAIDWIKKQTLQFQLARQELREAKQLRIEEAEDRGDQRALRAAKSIRVNMNEHTQKEVGFAWVDGVFWERWIRTTYGFEVKDGERVIINDEDNQQYWDVTSNGGFIVPSRTSILETLPKVVANPPKLKPKLTTSSLERFFFRVRAYTKTHPYVSLGLFLGITVGVAYWGRGRIRRGKALFLNGTVGQGGGGGFFRLDGKEGLLGSGTANGKHD
ncbi:MAG: hypothetical protein M1814_004712 [Vezdaea aestivalis]|nr:MAG: hypothetical protein M1814_004712 [Vezdaea aestivalis]